MRKGELLKPFAESMMRKYAVSTRINAVQNNDEDCSVLIAHGSLPVQPSLLRELQV